MGKTIVRRNLGLQVLWTVLTFGFYTLYWFHVTNEEMAAHLKRDEPVALWTVLFILPPACLYSYYKEGELYEQIVSGQVSRWIIFLLWIVFPPAVWFMIQTRLNSLAMAQAPYGGAITPT
jgi:hypothetical protein